MLPLQVLQHGKLLASCGFHHFGKKTYHHSDAFELSFSGNSPPKKLPNREKSGLGMVKRLLKLVSVGLLGALPLTVASPSAKAQDMSAVYIATAAATMDTGSSTSTPPRDENQQQHHDQSALGLISLGIPVAVFGTVWGLSGLKRWIDNKKKPPIV